MAISNEDFAAYVAMVLSGSGSDAEKAATINAAARAYGISNRQIAEATGYSLDLVNAFLALPPPPPSPPLPPPPPEYTYDNYYANPFVDDY